MDTKRQKVESLWKTCFDDTDEFVQFYFDRKYRDENALLHEENGQVVAALQMIPYPMTWAGTTLQASYISGACTLPEARNKGIMTSMLAEAFRVMYHRGIDLSFLIPAEPWLYGYYQKTGYAPVFEHTWETYIPTVPASAVVSLNIPAAYAESLAKDCFPFFSREMQKRECCVQHSYDDFVTILQDHYASGGRLLITTSQTENPSITGLAFALPAENVIQISELLGESPEVRTQLLDTASRLWDRPVIWKRPAQGGKSEKGGMARIIHAEKMLTRFAASYPHTEFTLQITDPLLPDNNGYYTVSNGYCHKKKNIEKENSVHMDMFTLTQALLGGLPGFPAFPLRQPYLSLMLD